MPVAAARLPAGIVVTQLVSCGPSLPTPPLLWAIDLPRIHRVMGSHRISYPILKNIVEAYRAISGGLDQTETSDARNSRRVVGIY